MKVNIWFSVLLFVIGILVGIFALVLVNYRRGKKAKKEVDDLLQNAKKEAEKFKRDAAIEQKEEAHKLRLAVDKDIREKKAELKQFEERLYQREANLDKRDENFQKRESSLDERDDKLSKKVIEIQNEQSKVEDIKKEQLDLLEKISGFSKDKAREKVMSIVKDNMNKEISIYIRERENEAKLEADKVARDYIVTSMQKYAADIASDQTVTVVDLPSEEMKGRIIGREGRNIRTIEAITGVDLNIDDTPEAVVLSSFDPLRREIARITLESLIKDGRIHPTRIEEIYDKTCKDMKQKIIEYGQEATFELGLTKFDSELIELIGKLNFRTSYGQNALQHSLEVAHLSGILAGELGENINLAKRAGLLHDIGKAIDHEVEGPHAIIGADLARRYGESPAVVHAIEAHHNDVEPNSVVAVLVQAADAISAARPGARRESAENYIKRLEKLEEISNSHEGVERTFAMQAGREVHVMVEPDKISDSQSVVLAHDIAHQIEDEMEYPGQVRVVVIRESRAVDVAK